MKHISSVWWPEAMRRSPLLLLVPLCTFLFFYRLDERGLSSSHEARAAQHAQMMLSEGCWTLPTLFNRRIDLQKPPFYYWLVAATSWLCGGPVDAWSVRFPAALAALLCVLLVYQTLAECGRPRAGLWAAVMLATCVHFTWLARVGRIDMPLTLMTTLALTAALTNSRWRIAIAYMAVGTGVLLKGPIAAVLPAVVLVPATILSSLASRRKNGEGQGSADGRDDPPRRRFAFPGSPCWGLPLMLLIALPWFLHANEQTEGRLWRDFFIHHNLQRGLGGADDLAGEPLWYYLPRLFVDLCPWSLAALIGVWWMLKDTASRQDADARFGLLWFSCMVCFLSFIHFKRADYLLPAYPGFAIWLGCLAERKLTRSTTHAGVLLSFACVLAWGVFLEAMPRQHEARGYQRFAQEIRRRTARPVIFFRTEAHEVAFHVARPLDTILEWENLDVWANLPHTIYMVMPPECAAAWQDHLRSGCLEEVMRTEPDAGARPLVLMRSLPQVDAAAH